MVSARERECDRKEQEGTMESVALDLCMYVKDWAETGDEDEDEEEEEEETGEDHFTY